MSHREIPNPKTRVDRKTLWSFGRKGQPDWMRVLIDVKQDRVEVLYKDAQGLKRKEVFANDRTGRTDAIAWAEEFRDERKRLGTARAEYTHAQLWKAYTESPAWADLRDTSRPSYVERWKRWAHFRGASTRPDDTTLHHIDRFITAGREQKYAINQIRQALNVARVVYNWGQSRKLITENVFGGWRWKAPKDAAVLEPEEYTDAEFVALLSELSPQHSRTWRAWVALMIAGHHGQRANAVLHLTWDVIGAETVTWDAKYQKNGRALVQPLTWDMVAAIETARYWQRKMLYRGPWVIFGGTTASRGETREFDAWMKDPKHKRVGTGKGKARVVADRPFSYSGLHGMVVRAEKARGITHKPNRALHGFRKMAAGNVADRTGDTRLGMEWIGDDIRQAPKYLKRRETRLDRAAEASTTDRNDPKQTPNQTRTTVPELSPTKTAPKGAVGSRSDD